jgi:hypothetical protein
VQYEIAVGEEDYKPLVGRRPLGRLYLGGDSVMSAQIFPEPGFELPILDGRVDPQIVSYSGRWTVVGRELLIRVELSADPAWNGSIQRRRFAVVGGNLILHAHQSSSTFRPGAGSRARAVWRRMSVPT